MTIEVLKNEVLKLSLPDRLDMLKLLADSLATDSLGDEITPELEATWNRRIEEVRSGAVETISAEDMEKQLRAKYGISN